jgi:anthranilate synthase component 1
MNFEKFKALAKDFNLIPVYETMTADMLTPVLAYLKIREKGKMSFLLESVEGSVNLARYSFIGNDPQKVIRNKHLRIEVMSGESTEILNENLFDYLINSLKNINQSKVEGLPDFTGGVVGYIGYENISLIEPQLVLSENSQSQFDSCLGYFDTILAFDHFTHQIILISNVDIHEFSTFESAFRSAKEKISNLRIKLMKPLEHLSDFKLFNEPVNDFDLEEFKFQVEQSKNNIKEGDIFQIVLSKKFRTEYSGDLINVYRALRIINPSPYMYYLECPGNFTVVGTSPEDLIKVKDGKAQLLPIAGTRRRGNNPSEDFLLEKELINDPKEIAEHTMLLDLGRNDLGRVCKYESVKVLQQMEIQKYSHVMHLVSKIEGTLEDQYDAIDAFKACFPAGTVTGAPKIRAMELINKYEKSFRNVYAGAIGYFDFSGNLDTCIAIRTLFATESEIVWQAGAGIVADSTYEFESHEIRNKAAVIINALKYAEVIDEHTRY